MRMLPFAASLLALLLPAAAATGQCQLQKLLPEDHLDGDQFGDSVALSGTFAVVGASRDDEPFSSSGSVVVFRFDGIGWVEDAKLVPAAGDGAENDLFGWSVGLDAFAPGGPVVVVGAYLDDDPANAGSAYVFRRSGGTWTQEAKLVATDRAAGDEFGQAVAVTGDLIAVGAARDDDGGTDTGSVYVFRRQGAVWSQTAKLMPATPVAFDRFGISVAVDASIPGEQTIIAGAALHDFGPGLENAGCASVFRWDGVSWTEEPLPPPFPGEGDKFGQSVAIAGDVAVVGAHLDDDAASNGGVVWVFRYDGTGWDGEAPVSLTPGDPGVDDQFGRVVSITSEGSTIAVGAALEDANGNAAGAVYLFDDLGGFWTQTAKLLATDGRPNDEFGISVAIDDAPIGDGRFVLAGANKDDDPIAGVNAGSAYVFTTAVVACEDCDGDLVPDVNQILDDPGLDCNGNGVLDVCEIDESSGAAGGPFYCTEGCDPDCNENGVPDACDLTSGVSPDLDGNGIPDECEDCNNNGIPDETDIAEGTAQDCDGDLLPDSCAIDEGLADDCNGNGIPDDCDLDPTDPDGNGVVSIDCDGDDRPDECDDCNGNGIADSCDVDPTDPDGDGNVSVDGDGNGVPDECEDCNQNGLPDFLDLFLFPNIDCDGNGMIDDCEIDEDSDAPGGPFYCSGGCAADCNENGILDACDVTAGTSEDADGNGVPDECEDCNENGTPDGLDILAGGGSVDCDGNGIPDECQIHYSSQAPGGPFFCITGCSVDCNLNGIPDVCDVSSGTSDDCSGNGVPDECEPDCNGNGVGDDCDISSGTALDINGNGIPDSCEPDCDDDGVPDFIEILYHLVPDCDDNGVPDSCDLDPTDPDGDGIVHGDADGDGIPDPCDAVAEDLDADGTVGFNDLVMLLGQWGDCSPCVADLDGDGFVGFDDLVALLAAWSP